MKYSTQTTNVVVLYFDNTYHIVTKKLPQTPGPIMLLTVGMSKYSVTSEVEIPHAA